LGAQPDPFCLEVRLPKDETWTLEDVTKDLIEAGENTIKEAQAKKEEREEAAVKGLAEVVKERFETGNPILKTEAQNYLHDEMEITRDRSRELVNANNKKLWEFQEVGGKGSGKGLFPVGLTNPPRKSLYEGKSAADHAQSGPQECAIDKTLQDKGILAEAFTRRREFTEAKDSLNGGLKEADHDPFDEEEKHYIREERAAIVEDALRIFPGGRVKQ
jgi:hypothetical protein